MKKELIGANPDGSPHYLYTFEGPEGGGLIVTGPIAGTVALVDGTVYSVTPEVIEHVAGHQGPILHHIEQLHEKAGTFGDFAHVCTDACGAENVNATPAVEAPAPGAPVAQ